MTVEARLRRRFTGKVLASLAVEPDTADWTVTCTVCEGDVARPVAAGDRITVAATKYENHSWELVTVACPKHEYRTVADVMAIRAEEQVLLEATLEPAGYHSPDGTFYPDALTLGAIEILDYSPTEAGY